MADTFRILLESSDILFVFALQKFLSWSTFLINYIIFYEMAAATAAYYGLFLHKITPNIPILNFLLLDPMKI